MNEIDDLKNKVKRDWMDVYGFITLNPAAGSNPLLLQYDSENQIHFSSIYYTLINLLGNLDYEDHKNIHKALSFISVKDNGTTIPGLFSRHPDPYSTSPQHHGISHDEMNGLVVLKSFTYRPYSYKDVYDYGKKYYWSYIDEAPYSHPFQSWDNFKKYIGRVRLPRDVCFYKFKAGVSPNFLEWGHLIVTALLTTLSSKETTSGKILAFMRFMNFPRKHWFYKVIYPLFSKIMKHKYGEFYMEEVFKTYFTQPNHPFHELIKLCRGKY